MRSNNLGSEIDRPKFYQYFMPLQDAVLAKRLQHCNATYCNIVLEQHVAHGTFAATRCDMLGVVGSNLKMVKFFSQHMWMLHDVVTIWPAPCNTLLRPGMMRTSSIFNTQQVATRHNRVAKRAQHVASNNVGICYAEVLRSFNLSLQMLGQQRCDMLRWNVGTCCVAMLKIGEL